MFVCLHIWDRLLLICAGSEHRMCSLSAQTVHEDDGPDFLGETIKRPKITTSQVHFFPKKKPYPTLFFWYTESNATEMKLNASIDLNNVFDFVMCFAYNAKDWYCGKPNKKKSDRPKVELCGEVASGDSLKWFKTIWCMQCKWAAISKGVPISRYTNLFCIQSPNSKMTNHSGKHRKIFDFFAVYDSSMN